MNELKVGFGHYMAGFYSRLSPTTKALSEFVSRGLSKSIVYAPSRMVDAVEDMLASWRKNDNSGTGAVSPFLPVIIIATAKDYMPATGDYSIQHANPVYVTLPDDKKERVFKMRQMVGDRRAQVAICAADEPTARSIAAQFSLYISDPANRTFSAPYRFAGFDLPFPVKLETIDAPAMNIETEQKNLTILAMDLSLRETIPIFDFPRDGELHDGRGVVGDFNNPSGYQVTSQSKLLDKDTGVVVVTK
ncbi:hypothetical protein [Undibacterium crateris]|uniref:hypothetical protein n=1 Tax=Undibacterium crateris TaxID=2528175 RepID=UPI00138A10A0|nr:hypothetical protein [Undibacterium crateris]NDI85084.1 hypothetical protein [Undibacterium crateris]